MKIQISNPDDLVSLVDHPDTVFKLLVIVGTMTIADEHGTFTLTYSPTI